MNAIEPIQASETAFRRDFLPAACSHLRGRRVLLAAGAVIAGAGLAFNWSLLVVAGIAPLLLGVLPCVAMCALGLCVNRMASSSGCTRDVSTRQDADGPTGTAGKV